MLNGDLVLFSEGAVFILTVTQIKKSYDEKMKYSKAKSWVSSGLLLQAKTCSLNSPLKHKALTDFWSRPSKKNKTQSASSFLCSDVAWPQLSACNPGCQEVVPVSAAFVTLLSTVVPQRLFLMLIYGFSILDMEWGSMGGWRGGWGSRRQ